MTAPPVAGLRVLGRKENTASAKVQVLELNPNEFTYTATEMIKSFVASACVCNCRLHLEIDATRPWSDTG